MRIVVNKLKRVYLDFVLMNLPQTTSYARGSKNVILLPVHKKYRIASLLCIFERIIQFYSKTFWCNGVTSQYQHSSRERSGSVVERLTRDRGAAGSSLTGVTVLCP